MNNKRPSPLPGNIPAETIITITIDNITGKMNIDFNIPIPAIQMINICSQLITAQATGMMKQATGVMNVQTQIPLCFDCRRGVHNHIRGQCGSQIEGGTKNGELYKVDCECTEGPSHAT